MTNIKSNIINGQNIGPDNGHYNGLYNDKCYYNDHHNSHDHCINTLFNDVEAMKEYIKWYR